MSAILLKYVSVDVLSWGAYFVLNWFARSSNDSMGWSNLDTVRKAAKLAVYVAIMMKPNTHHVAAISLPDKALGASPPPVEDSDQSWCLFNMLIWCLFNMVKMALSLGKESTVWHKVISDHLTPIDNTHRSTTQNILEKQVASLTLWHNSCNNRHATNATRWSLSIFDHGRSWQH